MCSLKSRLAAFASRVDDRLDSLETLLLKRLHFEDPLQIVPYRSYGTTHRLYVTGRVLKDKGIQRPTDKDSLWNNLVSMYKRFESDEVPGATLRVHFDNKRIETITNSEGYFTVNLAPDTSLPPGDMWHEVQVELIASPYDFKQGIAAEAHVLVPPADAEYGIISDIDDTVVKTGATSLLAMSRNTFFHNAHSRLPFAGVSEFYKALQLGRNGKRNNPFFYVSSSPWNLYDLLVDFLDINDIPAGPLLLRDYGIDKNTAHAGHMSHKFKEIKQILETYPHLPFILIGDSGQEDPKIYAEVVARFPGRILAVYIRDVQLAEREKIAVDISKSLADKKVEMVIVDNTVEAAEHAARHQLIFSETIPAIETDKRLDKGELAGKESLSGLT